VLLHGFGMIRRLRVFLPSTGAPSASAACPEMALGIPLMTGGNHER
jgi:hypothetical protein